MKGKKSFINENLHRNLYFKKQQKLSFEGSGFSVHVKRDQCGVFCNILKTIDFTENKKMLEL